MLCFVRLAKPRLMTSSSASWSCNIRTKPTLRPSISRRPDELALRNAGRCRATGPCDGWVPRAGQVATLAWTSAWGQRAEAEGSAAIATQFP